MVYFVTRMQGKIVMRRELTGLSEIWHGEINAVDR